MATGFSDGHVKMLAETINHLLDIPGTREPGAEPNLAGMAKQGAAKYHAAARAAAYWQAKAVEATEQRRHDRKLIEELAAACGIEADVFESTGNQMLLIEIKHRAAAYPAAYGRECRRTVEAMRAADAGRCPCGKIDPACCTVTIASEAGE